MSKIGVCGLVNLETTVPVDNFPLNYNPVTYKFFGITTRPSGVGLNLAGALSTLGDEVKLMTLCGNDFAGNAVKEYLVSHNIDTSYLRADAKSTAQSVVLYDNEGKRSVYCDLTDMQDISYSEEAFAEIAKDLDAVVLCNINFSRHLLSVAKNMGLLIATDVHCLSNINDEYNLDYIKACDVLFLSNEFIIGREEEFVNELKEVSSAKIIVVGMGKEGALLYERDKDSFKKLPSVYTRPVVNTIGAGDSLFSAFLHFYIKTKNAEESLKYATFFASYKIGDTSASRGFLSEEELINLVESKG